MRFISCSIFLSCALVCAAGVHAQEVNGGGGASYEYYEGQGDYRFVAVASSDKPSDCLQLTDRSVYSVSADAGDSLFATGDRLSVFLKTAQFDYIPDP